MYDTVTLSATLFCDTVWRDRADVILSTNHSESQVPSRSVERWWERSSSRPYHATLPYTVKRFFSPSTAFAYYTQDLWGVQREERGYYQPVEQGTALGYTSAPELFDLGESQLDDAKNACFDAMMSQVWNAPVFAAELHKTGDSVSKLAAGLQKSAALWRKHGSSPRKALRSMIGYVSELARGRRTLPPVTSTVAGLWLQWRYEVNTLVLDVQNAARTTASLLLDQTNQAKTSILRSRSGAVDCGKLEIYDSAWGRNIGLMLSLGSNVSHYVTRVGHAECKAWLTVYRTNSFLTDANQLGLINLPVALYELTPLSFVVDWFLDIGSFLERCTAGLGYNIVDGGYSVLRRISGEHTVKLHDLWNTPVRTFSGSGPYEASVYERHVWSNPAPVWTPAIRMNMNRVLDAASLIRQIPGGRIRAF
jgi:hypothetical protein